MPGLFGIRNIPEEQLQPFLLAEAPRILFPFARQIVAEAVQDGGFPPLLLDPIDFGALYMQQRGARRRRQRRARRRRRRDHRPGLTRPPRGGRVA